MAFWPNQENGKQLCSFLHRRSTTASRLQWQQRLYGLPRLKCFLPGPSQKASGPRFRCQPLSLSQARPGNSHAPATPGPRGTAAGAAGQRSLHQKHSATGAPSRPDLPCPLPSRLSSLELLPREVEERERGRQFNHRSQQVSLTVILLLRIELREIVAIKACTRMFTYHSCKQ